MAYYPKSEVDQVLASCRMEARTRNTITNVLAFRRELEIIRDRGYAIDDEEIEEGIRCIAAPVLDSANRAVAAMSASGPSSRITPARFELIGKTVLAATRELSTHIGYRQAASPSSSKRKRSLSR